MKLWTVILFLAGTKVFAQIDPSVQYPDLFRQVQMQQIFQDQKTFADCIPKYPADTIKKKYWQQKESPGFNLREFVALNFDTLFIDTSAVLKHIDNLWSYLKRPPDTAANESSLIPLPYSYIVPGGRFREIYYWDSYFTMLGLAEAGKYDLIEQMIDNFSYLIDTYGHIPNGNRTYYLSRSQPPFYSLMIELLAGIKGQEVYKKYLPYLEKEYEFWMTGAGQLNDQHREFRHVVWLAKDEILNRYWDEKKEPRPEAYKWDVELKNSSGRNKDIYSDIRATAESGWDFSSRWFHDSLSMKSIETTQIIPVDLNCLMYHLEITLAKAYTLNNNMAMHNQLMSKANKRKELLLKYFWNEKAGYFFDYIKDESLMSERYTLAGVYPLFFHLADQKQAGRVKAIIEKKFLHAGGLTTTLINTGEQWDFPNGWAPLQWIGYIALKNYGYQSLASELAKRWTGLNCKVYFETGKMMEKYDVVNLHRKGGGGEYKLQDGFGWTNGVFIALWNELHND